MRPIESNQVEERLKINLGHMLRLVLALFLISASAGAQTSPAIVGTWRLVSFVAADASGKLRPVWGDHPSGLIVYTADGHMAAQLYDPARARLGPIANASPLDPTQPSFAGLYTYFGTFALDTVKKTVTHKVEGAMASDWVGGSLVRGYRFLTPDRIELSVITDSSGAPAAGQSILVWERVRQ
jgi:Lipocalin-like domain